MKPLMPAVITDEEVQRNVEMFIKQWIAGEPVLRQQFNAPDEATARRMICQYIMRMVNEESIFKNDVYQVNVRPATPLSKTWPGPPLVHLSIKRIDRQPIHDWRDLQEIKNQLMGTEFEAVELYPAESRKVDTANQYHLWCLAKPDHKFPFGFGERVVTDSPLGYSVNRPVVG